MPTVNDIFDWRAANGSITIAGSDDTFDPNYYAGQSREEGFSTGDLLRLHGAGMNIVMNSWNSGYAFERGIAGRVTFSGIEQIYGSAGNDTFRAGAITEALDGWRGVSFFGGAGNDNATGSRFADFFDPGDGNDIIWAGLGDDHIDASRGNDTIHGGGGGDNIRWGGGNSGSLAPGDDVLVGGEGHDLVNLWAHYGEDDGSPGTSVRIRVVETDGAMTGTGTVQIDDAGNTDTARFRGFEQGWTHQGNDNIDASGAVLRGTVGILWGARWGDDVLIGSAGNDTLEGGPGSDTLTGGRGDDLLTAGDSYYDLNAPGDGDTDTLIFRAGDGADTVTGFDQGIDVLDCGGREYRAIETGEGTLLDFGGGDTVLVIGGYGYEVI